MMDIRDLKTYKWYRAQNPATLARRLYGRNVTVFEDYPDDEWDMPYRIWTAVRPDGTVCSRFYTADMSWRGEYSHPSKKSKVKSTSTRVRSPAKKTKTASRQCKPKTKRGGGRR